MSSRKLNLPLIIHGVHMFDDQLFFQPQYFECKQADIEQINNKVSKKLLSPPGERGVERVLFIWFSYTRSIGGVQFGI